MDRSIPPRTGCRLVLAIAIAALFGACGAGKGPISSHGADGSSSLGGTTSPDGNASTQETMATTSSCSILPVNPSITFQKTCPSFVPSLGNDEVVFVDQTTSGPPGNQVVAHRFRATAACGFDFVVSLPNLQFAADDQPYQVSKWWLQNANTGETGLIAIVIRRQLAGAVLLGVAVAESAFELNSLVRPLAVTLNGPACTDPARANSTSQILESNGTPLSCEDEADGHALRLCRNGASAYRMVAYSGSPDSTALPAVFGASDLLAPLD